MPAQKHVWVVEQGEYSSYRVVGVFSSFKNAELVKNAINSSEYSAYAATVDKWPTDPAVAELAAGLSRWFVLMLRDGSTEKVEKNDMTPYELGSTAHVWERTKAPAYRDKGIPDVLQANVWAKDAKHAIKIVNEMRAQFIATGKF